MSSVQHGVRGRFISALQELVPISPIRSHQISAAAHPDVPTKELLASRKPSQKEIERRINDLLGPRC